MGRSIFYQHDELSNHEVIAQTKLCTYYQGPPIFPNAYKIEYLLKVPNVSSRELRYILGTPYQVSSLTYHHSPPSVYCV